MIELFRPVACLLGTPVRYVPNGTKGNGNDNYDDNDDDDDDDDDDDCPILIFCSNKRSLQYSGLVTLNVKPPNSNEKFTSTSHPTLPLPRLQERLFPLLALTHTAAACRAHACRSDNIMRFVRISRCGLTRFVQSGNTGSAPAKLVKGEVSCFYNRKDKEEEKRQCYYLRQARRARCNWLGIRAPPCLPCQQPERLLFLGCSRSQQHAQFISGKDCLGNVT